MGKSKTNRQKEMDYIKANRKGSRDAEIENDGKFKAKTKIHKSMKAYSRKDRYVDEF